MRNDGWRNSSGASSSMFTNLDLTDGVEALGCILYFRLFD
jgi:hypothetical protein